MGYIYASVSLHELLSLDEVSIRFWTPHIKFKRSKHIMQTVLLLSALAWASDWGISSYDVSMYSRMHQLHLQIFRVSSCLSVLFATRTVQNFQLWRLQSWSSHTRGIIKVDMLQLHTLQPPINWGRGLGTSVWDLQACRARAATYLYVSAPC